MAGRREGQGAPPRTGRTSVAGRQPAPRAGRRSRRQDIVEAALRVLGRAGAEGFSASALAAEAGVSKANVFHHFDSLDAVVLAAFEHAFGGAGMFPPTAGQGLAGWLRALGEGVLAQLSQQRGLLAVYFVLASRAMADPVWQVRVGSHMDRFRRALGTHLAAFPEGRDAARREALADAVFFSLDGLGLHALMAPGRTEALARGWSRIVAGLADRQGERT
jgi:AcrR family transcriptional regulator